MKVNTHLVEVLFQSKANFESMRASQSFKNLYLYFGLNTLETGDPV